MRAGRFFREERGEIRGFMINFVCQIKKCSDMSIFRVILCIIFPPLAVLDRGCGSVILVFLLTLCGWVPGVIGAILLNRQ